MRERTTLTEKTIKLVFALRNAGYTTTPISEMTGQGKSTIQSVFRTAQALAAKDYKGVCHEIGTNHIKSLTNNSRKKIGWICNAIGIAEPTEEELRKAWAESFDKRENEAEVETTQLRFETPKVEDETARDTRRFLTLELMVLERILDQIQTEPITDVIEEIKEDIEDNKSLLSDANNN